MHRLWEYKVEAVRVLEWDLQRLGADGWELVAIHHDRMIFKRPVSVELPSTLFI